MSGVRERHRCIALIVAAVAAAYANSLHGPFVFDDFGNIVENEAIRRLWPVKELFLNGRPVVVFTWAVNYALGGVDTLPYHLTNLAIHVLAALTLFGVVRRTLELPAMSERLRRRALPLALATALIWALHPLQTQAVTYLTQRYESLMGLLYLAALYCLIRAATSVHAVAWTGACVAAALLAMGAKEVAVSAPIVLLLYDRAFLAGSVREAWARRRGLYAGLLGAWLGFALLQALATSRGAWAGYGLPHSWREYALTQFGVILHYVRLSLWPHPLVLDYGWRVARGAREILPAAIGVGALAAASAYALVRSPRLGFAGAWFFLILAPTSSVLPLADLAFQHRMYLPLAAIVVLAVLGVEAAAAAGVRRGWPGATAAAAGTLAAAAVALGAATWERNGDYESGIAIWRDTVAKVPGNSRAQSNLGGAYQRAGDLENAVVHLREAVRLTPDFPVALNSLGLALIQQGHPGEAVGHLREAVRLQPTYVDALSNLGVAYGMLGKLDESVASLREALRIEPNRAGVLRNLSRALTRQGRYAEAAAVARTLRTIAPGSVEEAVTKIPDAGR